MDRDEIAVIFPCYNEAQTIGKVVDDFHREITTARTHNVVAPLLSKSIYALPIIVS